MKSISTHDSSILAFLAQDPAVPREALEELVGQIEDARAQRTAQAILDPSESTAAAIRAAEELKAWAGQQTPTIERIVESEPDSSED